RHAGEIRDLLSDPASRERRKADVESHADHRERWPKRVPRELDQDAAELAAFVQQVVRPLELDACEALGVERGGEREPDRERQRRKISAALFEAPAEREREAAADDRRPAATAPSASGRLAFGGEQMAMNVAVRGAACKLAAG